MKFLALLGALTVLLGAPVFAAPHVDDPAQLLPADSSAAAALEEKLAAFRQATQLDVFVQFHAKSPPAVEDSQPGVYMRGLARQLGTAERGAVAVYFADEDDWRLWIGDATTAVFVGHPGTAHALTESGAIHDVKEALLTEARAAADAAWSAAQKAAPAGETVPPARRVQLQADAVLTRLLARLQPRPPTGEAKPTGDRAP